MSKFANSKFFLCHVAGIFPSRGRTFSLARPCFGACRDTCIGCMICKNFYIIFAFCPCIFLHLACSRTKGQNAENADLRAKTSEFMSKNAVKTGKSYFPILCRKWVKRYTETAFWMQKRAKRTKKRRFWRKLKILPTSLKISTLCKITSIFEEKNFAFRLHLQTTLQIFIHLIITQLQYIFCVFVFLRFCVFACKKCMGSNPLYIIIIKYLIIK